MVTAVGDGASAATELERYASSMQKKTGLHPEVKTVKKPENTVIKENKSNSADNIFTEDMLSQLNTVFSRMENSLILKMYLDERDISSELKYYMEALSSLTDKLSTESDYESNESEKPCVKILNADGSETGLAFHGVPGGHEFTSFVLGIYNASGSGQSIDESLKKEIRSVNKTVDIKIIVSLTCTMCPELVTAVQKIASENENITAEVYDLNHFRELKDKYNVMSVPCMVINSDKVVFGKKNIQELIQIIKGL